MLKLFSKDVVQYPNARDTETQKYTRFEGVQPRFARATPTPQATALQSSRTEYPLRKMPVVKKRVVQPQTIDTVDSSVLVSNDLHCETEVSLSILRAALPMRFAKIDASQGASSIHEAFSTNPG